MDAMKPFRDPWAHFDAWFEEARAAEPDLAEAVNLATADARGRPSNRMVLVRTWSPRGFEFFTDRESQKGAELVANPWAALCWHWKSLGREVRAQGAVAVLDDAASDAYWRGRPRASQVAAITSHQSQPIASRVELDRRYAEVDAAVEGVPERPGRWGGYRLAPDRVEFWVHHDDRLHDRLLYARSGDAWTTAVLQP